MLGHIPNFTDSIFPKASIPNLTLVANVGIILFLFVVGLEIDTAYVKKNWKIACTVGFTSLIVPFGLGWGLAVGLYREYVEKVGREDISFGVFGLFIGVAIAITAFPVLARILTELGLLRDRVGVIVLSAGISNDIVGWILLALTITLANSAKAINTLYIILLTIAWFVLLVWAVQPILTWYLRKDGSIKNGPSEMAVSVIILLVFVSAFYTDIIGVHPIFGSFLAGVIIPRENQFVVKLTEKIEDFITLILLPLYFALAGLNVNLESLNDGTSWGYVFAAIFTALFGKVVGGAIPARFHGLRWRESFAVGGLMSCKGIVEIVVLQLGLQAGILSIKVFTMFVIMALVTTFLTTPLTLALYPVWYRTKVERWRNGEIEWDGTPIVRSSDGEGADGRFKEFRLAKVVAVLDNVESMPITMMFIQMLAAPQQRITADPDVPHSSNSEPEYSDLSAVPTDVTIPGAFLTRQAEPHGLWVSGLRLIDFTERTADLIQVMSGELIDGDRDPVIKTLSTFASIHHIPFEGKMAITPQQDRSKIVMSMSQTTEDFLLTTWDDEAELVRNPRLLKLNPQAREGALRSHIKLALIRDLFERAKCQVGVVIDRGYTESGSSATSRRVYFPFFGGANDNLGLGLALYLAKNTNVQVTIAVIGDVPETTSSAGGHEDPGGEHQTLLPSESWDYVTGVYDALSQDLKSKVTLTRLDPQQSMTTSVLHSFEGVSLATDLVIIGRCTSNTPNSNTVDHQLKSSSESIVSASAQPDGDLFGAATAELVTSPQLKCSFLVCSASSALPETTTTGAPDVVEIHEKSATVSVAQT